ncbi:hypothetical protein ACN47E_008940 [Coniothyrium glycines]
MSSSPQKRSTKDRLGNVLRKVFHPIRNKRKVASDVESLPATSFHTSTQPQMPHLFQPNHIRVDSATEPPKPAALPSPLHNIHPLASPGNPPDPHNRNRVESNHSAEVEAAMAGLRAAEILLEQRHTTIRAVPQPNVGKKLVNKSGEKGAEAGAHQPEQLRVTFSVPKVSPTANDECEALRSRQLLRELVLSAVDGCPNAIKIVGRLNNHLDSGNSSNLTLDFKGEHIHTKRFTAVDFDRVARYNVVKDNAALVDRRLLSIEDSEDIYTQLFPEERDDILKPEYFEIFMAGLGEESIFTTQRAKEIARLGVSVEEFDKGVHFKGPKTNASNYKNNPAGVIIFDMPKDVARPQSSLFPRPVNNQSPGLYKELRILVEAAVYNQQHWKGYFFANARSKLADYHLAWETTQDGFLLPPHLSPYKRAWTYREIRLLQRGALLCNLLSRHESGDLTDFGILRAVRSTYVPIPAQPFFGLDDLESFLYHRILHSGLPLHMVPEILALHPEHDAAFGQPRTRALAMEALVHRALDFEEEETQRLSEIEASLQSFEMAVKAQMTAWQRVKSKAQKVFGRKKESVPFDPFAPEHEKAE